MSLTWRIGAAIGVGVSYSSGVVSSSVNFRTLIKATLTDGTPAHPPARSPARAQRRLTRLRPPGKRPAIPLATLSEHLRARPLGRPLVRPRPPPERVEYGWARSLWAGAAVPTAPASAARDVVVAHARYFSQSLTSRGGALGREERRGPGRGAKPTR